ncbi:stage II sporulation protein P [Anaeroselena agilis]|uniref:Stage II sporulation protein P n=1 Tax=Anaeroselena agilis TaxID=3063788 RepID=A0ABU3NYW4_9FIRM|nr:stage II sporulation protein P [Selenomonadales bacterium 4137-cl]
MVTRRERKQREKRKLWLIAAAAVVIAAMFSGVYCIVFAQGATDGGDSGQGGKVPGFLVPWRDILSSGIPGFGAGDGVSPVKVRPVVTVQSFIRKVILFVTGVDIKDMRSLLRAEIPLMGLFKPGTPAVSAITLPNFPKFEFKGVTPDGKPLVGIYHTHTAESFVPSCGASHKPGGQRGEIVEVGAALQKRLAQHGIAAVHSRNIHDFPSFMKAYGPSEKTVRKMLADYPSIQMVFDIHRDAEKRDNVTVTVNGVAMARIALVVGMGQQDLVQPHWQQNHAFAKLIDARLNQHFPGLSRGIQLVDWRYNQHLHPRALLIEVGSQESSKEEAIRSIELLGDVVAEILSES